MKDLREIARDIQEMKLQKRELEHTIRRDEEKLMEELINQGRVDCLNINWTRLKNL